MTWTLRAFRKSLEFFGIRGSTVAVKKKRTGILYVKQHLPNKVQLFGLFSIFPLNLIAVTRQ
jgi:hypothetical protein